MYGTLQNIESDTLEDGNGLKPDPTLKRRAGTLSLVVACVAAFALGAVAATTLTSPKFQPSALAGIDSSATTTSERSVYI